MSYVRLILSVYAVCLLGFCTLLFIVVVPGSAKAISLREESVISDKTIKLGDIFYGLDRGADRVLGIAPRPGENMVLNARTLMRIAISMDLQWRPSSSADYLVLTRAATVVDRDVIEETLKSALEAKGINGKYNLLIPGEMLDIILPAGLPASIEISYLKAKPASNWFEATIVAPSKENPIIRKKISGTIERLIEVPVLKSILRKGTIIGIRDIEFINIIEREVKRDIIINAKSLVGMTPRKMLLAGKPVKASDIDTPKIVSRGEMVTMVFRSGSLSMTAKGKALENGAKGDVIRVVNMSSNRTVDAEVTASNEVTLRAF